MYSINEKQQFKKYFGKVECDELSGQQIWGVNKNDEMQHIADVRGWGSIQNMFKDQNKAMEFQDIIQKFIAGAINERLERLMKDEEYGNGGFGSFKYGS